MAEPLIKSNLEPHDISNYLTSQYYAESGIEDALAQLAKRRKLTGDPDERREIDTAVANQQEELLRIRDERTAFMAENLLIVPPSDEIVDNLKKIAERLDTMVASAVTARMIVASATEILTNWNSTRPAS